MNTTRSVLQFLVVVVPVILAAVLVVVLMTPLPVGVARSLSLAMLVTVLVQFVFQRRYVRAPLQAAAAHLARIHRDDVDPLGRAISELAIGDLTAQVSPRPEQNGSAAGTARRDPFGIAAATGRIDRALQQMRTDFSLVTATPIRRLCYVGSDSYKEGTLAGSQAARLRPAGGSVIVAIPTMRYTNYALRVKGFTNALPSNFTVVDTWEYHESVEEIARLISRCAADRQAFDVLYVGEGNAPPRFVEKLRAAGLLEGKTIIVHDTLPETVAQVRSGDISATISQAPYRQGYDPIVHVYNRIVAGTEPDSPRMLTQLHVITKDNVEEAENSENETLPPFTDIVPRDAPRIRVIGLGKDDFWEPLYRAVGDATREVTQRGGTVEWVIPENARHGDRGGEVMRPVIEDSVRDGFHGVILPVSDEDTVLAINEAVARGVIVATYNSELSSFRGLAAAVQENAVLLREVGDGVAAAAEQSRQAVATIHETVRQVSEKGREESESITGLTTQFTKVSQEVREASERASLGSETAEHVRSQSDDASGAVRDTADALGKFRDVSDESTTALTGLSERVKEISTILTLIQDMAEQTNVLAINAAVEAARAGEAGAGFKIVAGEIRGFAHDASDAAQRISGIIKHVGQHSGRLEQATNEVLTQAQQSLERIGHAEQALSTISEASGTNMDNMSQIAASVARLQEESERVTERLTALAEQLHSTTDAMGQIVGSTREMTEQSDDLAATAQQLRRSVHAIEAVVSQFMLE